MSKITVRSREKAAPIDAGALGFEGAAAARDWFASDDQPLHLRQFELAPGAAFRMAAAGVDRLIYVWDGALEIDGATLAAGSTLIVEHGRAAQGSAGPAGATLLCFEGSGDLAAPLTGGRVLALAAEAAPNSDELGGTKGLGGTMFADGDGTTNSLWLHANRFPPMEAPAPGSTAGVHSHSEDEIIFVVSGDIRLGARLHGPGTAVAIAADTLYSFTAGPNGLHFINFRAGRPGDIQFVDGNSISETEYWRSKLPRPEYREIAA